VAKDESLIAQALSAHEAAGPPPRSFGEAGEWGKRLNMTPEQHLVHTIYIAARDQRILPGGDAELKKVVGTARSAGIPDGEIDAAIAAAEQQDDKA
jgi:hypothetical protein